MLITKDFHVHESHSPDPKKATIQEYARVAKEKGIDEIGFATHFTISGPFMNMGIPAEQIPHYFEEIEATQRSTVVKLRIGLEVDYISGEEKHISQILNDNPFDFILGSIHYIGNNFIVLRNGFESFMAGRGINDAIIDYFSYWKKAVDSGLFDVMAHPDYFRRLFIRWKSLIYLFRNMNKSHLRLLIILKVTM